MHRTILAAAAVVALMPGTAMAQTSAIPNATGDKPTAETLDPSRACESSSSTAQTPVKGDAASTTRSSAGTAGSGTSTSASTNPATAMTDCGPNATSRSTTRSSGSPSPKRPEPAPSER
jgi:hypothetical protein